MGIRNKAMTALIGSSLRLVFKLPSGLPLPAPWLRQGLEVGGVFLRAVNGNIPYTAVTLGGIPAERLGPVPGRGPVVLYIHGGAFFAGSPRTHRALAHELARRSGATVYVTDYRLAPEHPYPAALDDAHAAYQALLAQGVAPEQIVVVGDSAGGSHALSLCLRLRDQHKPQPAGLVMVSPYLDVSLASPSVQSLAQIDPMLTATALQRGGDWFRGGIPALDARVSPLYADLHGLPSTLLQTGGAEILRDDSTRFAERAQAAGSAVQCRVFEGMWHDFQLFTGFLPLADEAVDEMAGFIRLAAMSSDLAA